MVLNVFVLQKINAGLGKCSMGLNVSSLMGNVPQIQNGMEHFVALFREIVLLDFMDLATSVF